MSFVHASIDYGRGGGLHNPDVLLLGGLGCSDVAHPK